MTATARAVSQPARQSSEPYPFASDRCRRAQNNFRAYRNHKIASGEWDARRRFCALPRLAIWIDKHDGTETGIHHSVLSPLDVDLYHLVKDIAAGKYAGKTKANGRRIDKGNLHGYILFASLGDLRKLLGWKYNSHVSRCTKRLNDSHIIHRWDLNNSAPAPQRTRHESGRRKRLQSCYFVPDYPLVFEAIRNDANIAKVDNGRTALIIGRAHRFLTPEEAVEWNAQQLVPERGDTVPQSKTADQAPAGTPPLPAPEPEPEPEVKSQYADVWADLCTELQRLVSRDTFDNWFRTCEVVNVEDGVVYLGVPHPDVQYVIDLDYASALNRAAELCGYSRVVCSVSRRLLDTYLETDPFWNPPKEPTPGEVPSAELLDALAGYTGSRDHYLENVVCEIRKIASHMFHSTITDAEMIELWDWAAQRNNSGRQNKASWYQSVVISRLGQWRKGQQERRNRKMQYEAAYARELIERSGDPDLWCSLLRERRGDIWFLIADIIQNRGSP